MTPREENPAPPGALVAVERLAGGRGREEAAAAAAVFGLLAGPELDSSPDWGAYIQIFLLVSVRCPGSVLCCTALIRFLSTPFRFSIIVGLGYGRRFLVQGWLRRRRCPSQPSSSGGAPGRRRTAPPRRRQLLIATSARRCGAGSSPAVLRRIVAYCTRRGRHLSSGDGRGRSCAGVAAQVR